MSNHLNEVRYRNRRAVQVENQSIRVTVTIEGGHVAEILHKPTGVNPLWTPPWPSIEPSLYDREKHPEYGTEQDAPLLAGIMGHNLCLDTFGAPGPEEAAAGVPVHGEASTALYQVSSNGSSITLETTLGKADLKFQRQIRLAPDGLVIHFTEVLENRSSFDRPIAWTQHVTLGPPFLAPGVTEFLVTATRSKVSDAGFTGGLGAQASDAEFDWPHCPLKGGGSTDLRTFSSEAVSGGYSAHQMDPNQEHAYFVAWSPASQVLVGYVWKRKDFPWLGHWEENHLRTAPPWNGQALTCGMEFGASPFPESRRRMVTRGCLFDTPTFRWIAAKERLQAEYCAFIAPATSMPKLVTWDGGELVQLRL